MLKFGSGHYGISEIYCTCWNPTWRERIQSKYTRWQSKPTEYRKQRRRDRTDKLPGILDSSAALSCTDNGVDHWLSLLVITRTWGPWLWSKTRGEGPSRWPQYTRRPRSIVWPAPWACNGFARGDWRKTTCLKKRKNNTHEKNSDGLPQNALRKL